MADLLMLAPWLVFAAGLGAIGFRLLRDHGSRAAPPRRPDGRREGR